MNDDRLNLSNLNKCKMILNEYVHIQNTQKRLETFGREKCFKFITSSFWICSLHKIMDHMEYCYGTFIVFCLSFLELHSPWPSFTCLYGAQKKKRAQKKKKIFIILLRITEGKSYGLKRIFILENA